MNDKDSGAELAAGGNDTTAATPGRQAHTPGPWTVDTIHGYDFALGVGTIDGVSALVTLTRDANGDRMFANAHLIAAAPSYHEAMTECLKPDHGYNIEYVSIPRLIWQKFLAAHAKAEGR